MSQSAGFRHTEMESTGRRNDGQIFRAHLWISTYPMGTGVRFAVISIDVSDELRDREEAGVDRLLANSRVLVGAVAHEIRNLCGAIAVAHTNLIKLPGVAESQDFRALGSLVEALRKLASAEVGPLSKNQLAAIPLSRVLDDLRIVIKPAFDDIGATISWELPPELPYIWADAQSLLQVFLNLTQNSCRAMKHTFTKTLTISCAAGKESAIVRISDTGVGVHYPERLFRPFQEGADAAGLGLYISRAIARSFGGDLKFESRKDGACFAVELTCAHKETRETA
jgi:two-component system sensor kinase FixL